MMDKILQKRRKVLSFLLVAEEGEVWQRAKAILEAVRSFFVMFNINQITEVEIRKQHESEQSAASLSEDQ